MESAQNRVDNTVDKIKSGIDTVGERASEMGSALMEKGAEYKKAAVRAGEKALKQTDNYVKENPRTSLLYAMGIGAVVGGVAALLLRGCISRE